MENLHRQFLDKSKDELTKLTENLQKSSAISADLRRECFRTLHTIKGTAQTFGFENAGFLAHELENLLSVEKNEKTFSDAEIFIEGLNFLRKTLEESDFEIPQSFLDKLYSVIPESSQKEDFSAELIREIPDQFIKTLSKQEKNALVSALKTGKNLFCLEVVFEIVNFAEKLKDFRAELSEKNEIIATFPGEKSGLQNEIGFRFILCGTSETSEIEKAIEPFSARIIYKKLPKSMPENLAEVLDTIIAHGKDIAEKSGKKIEFEVLTDEVQISGENLKLVFDILLHLVRNAVDHAVEMPEKRRKLKKDETGKIRIAAEKRAENDLLLTIADDGSGIDLEKLKAKALRQGFIKSPEILSEKATLELIFSPELSTADCLTEFSGRGIGLDAVKHSVEKAGGRIGVKSASGKGTRFEIFLPPA